MSRRLAVRLEDDGRVRSAGPPTRGDTGSERRLHHEGIQRERPAQADHVRGHGRQPEQRQRRSRSISLLQHVVSGQAYRGAPQEPELAEHVFRDRCVGLRDHAVQLHRRWQAESDHADLARELDLELPLRDRLLVRHQGPTRVHRGPAGWQLVGIFLLHLDRSEARRFSRESRANRRRRHHGAHDDRARLRLLGQSDELARCRSDALLPGLQRRARLPDQPPRGDGRSDKLRHDERGRSRDAVVSRLGATVDEAAAPRRLLHTLRVRHQGPARAYETPRRLQSSEQWRSRRIHVRHRRPGHQDRDVRRDQHGHPPARDDLLRWSPAREDHQSGRSQHVHGVPL